MELFCIVFIFLITFLKFQKKYSNNTLIGMSFGGRFLKQIFTNLMRKYRHLDIGDLIDQALLNLKFKQNQMKRAEEKLHMKLSNYYSFFGTLLGTKSYQGPEGPLRPNRRLQGSAGATE